MDMQAFFDSVRASFGSLKQEQVDGFNMLLDATAHLELWHRAYILATAWHETGRKMQPIAEWGARDYFDKYEPGTKLGKALGNTLKGDGYRFRGRGYVQITGRANYARLDKIIDADLVLSPDAALAPEFAVRIIVDGMVHGLFTGRALSDFDNYVDARRVVNGVDRNTPIAGYAEKFEAALIATRNIALQPEIAPAPPNDSPEAISPSWGLFWAWLARLFRRA